MSADDKQFLFRFDCFPAHEHRLAKGKRAGAMFGIATGRIADGLGKFSRKSVDAGVFFLDLAGQFRGIGGLDRDGGGHKTDDKQSKQYFHENLTQKNRLELLHAGSGYRQSRRRAQARRITGNRSSGTPAADASWLKKHVDIGTAPPSPSPCLEAPCGVYCLPGDQAGHPAPFVR